LTPDNILIDNDFNIKICNFEQSKIDMSEMNLQKKDGASSYTAPECHRNEFSQKCDVWSIGVIMYQLLSGIDPFRGDEIVQNFKRSQGCFAKFPQSAFRKISDDCIGIIKKMLTGDPDKRITIDEARDHKWFNRFDSESETYY